MGSRAGLAHQTHALVQLVRIGIERRAGQRRVTVDIGPALLFDGFAHSGSE
jgi:hypothetical protein